MTTSTEAPTGTVADESALTDTERDLLARADAWLAAHREEYVADLIDWVTYPSVARPDQAAPGAPFGPEVRRVFDRVTQRASELGFDTETHDGYAISLLGGNTTNEQEVGLVSHLDVVPEGTGWSVDPYAPFERDGFVVGRGSGDNKAAAVGDLYLLRILRDLDVPLKHRVRVLYGGAEEIGMPDLDAYVARGLGPVPRLSLVTDGSFPVNFAQKGGLDLELFLPAGPVLGSWHAGVADNAVPSEAEIFVPGADAETVSAALGTALAQPVPTSVSSADGTRLDAADVTVNGTTKDGIDGVLLKATGQSGHAAFPEGTRNAILLLATALAAAELVDGPDLAAARAVAQILATPYGHGTGIEYEDEESGRLTQNGGIIEPTEGGLLLHLDIRYSVTADPEELLAKITTAADEHGGHLHETRVSNRVYVAKDSPEVQLLQGAIGDVLGGTPEPYSMGGGTHSRVLPHSITFGPGFGSASEFLPAHIRDREPDFLGDGHKGAHGPNEYVDVDALFQALRIYLVTLLRLDAFLGDD